MSLSAKEIANLRDAYPIHYIVDCGVPVRDVLAALFCEEIRSQSNTDLSSTTQQLPKFDPQKRFRRYKENDARLADPSLFYTAGSYSHAITYARNWDAVQILTSKCKDGELTSV